MREEYFFYAPEAKTVNRLTEDEAAHAVRVLRFQKGDNIRLMDGKGSFYRAVITQADKRNCFYEISEEESQPRIWQQHLHIAMAPTKNIDRTEWFVEKAVEIGVDEITLLNTEFSERKKVNTERLERIIISAMKQSRKPFKTVLNGMTDFNSFVESTKERGRFICHCYGTDNDLEIRERKLLKEQLEKGSDTVVIVGPEGDFSIDEVAFAENHGFQGVSLGESRLRTETAALAAVHIMQLFT